MIKIERIRPIGTRLEYGFTHNSVDMASFGVIEVPVYPPREAGATEARKARMEAGLFVRDAAAALGLSVLDMSYLERGMARPAPPSTWDDVIAAYRAAGRCP